MLETILLLLLTVALAVVLRVYYGRVQLLQAKLRASRRQRKEVMDFLSLFTTSLSTVAELERAMELVAHYLCDLMEAESLCIFRAIEEDGQKRLQASAVAGLFPPLQRTSNMVMAKVSYLRAHLRKERIPFGEGVVGRVAERQQSILVEDASQLPDEQRLPRDIRTLLAVPMYVENRLTGVVCAVNCKQPERLFNATDLKTLENLSHQAAMASSLVSIYAERSRQERIEQELELARQIQFSLLPVTVPNFGDYQIHPFSRSALEVGGDFYDFIPMDENRLMILVADASGKGVPACMLMAMCQSFARAGTERFTMLETFLRDLNRHLRRDSDRSHFVTLAVVIIDRANNVCEYARAGHTELLLRMENGISRVIRPNGPALGLLPDDLVSGFDTLSFAFPPGTSLMLFTDGITEALNENGEEFGMDRLEPIWRTHDLAPEEMATKVLAEVNAFTGDEPQADDQTIMILSRPRTTPPPPVAEPGQDGAPPHNDVEPEPAVPGS